ncbi:hypothetical protein VARIO8X_110173 [Burkholderiales bacterium 8X]|nr:hypothetical protein VARIO8X_110173 [Burkholderiales bacterium 8X]
MSIGESCADQPRNRPSEPRCAVANGTFPLHRARDSAGVRFRLIVLKNCPSSWELARCLRAAPHQNGGPHHEESEHRSGSTVVRIQPRRSRPHDHLLRGADRFLDLGELRQHLAPFYSHTGRPSIAPELMIRMLVIGHCMGIRSERRLSEKVHLNLANR